MRIHLVISLSLALGATIVFGQAPSSPTYTSRAVEPSALELERMGLEKDFTVNLPVKSRADGIATVQPDGDQVFVQLRSGIIVCIRLATGETVWTYDPGAPPANIYPLAITPELRNPNTSIAAHQAQGARVIQVLGPKVVFLERLTGKVVDRIDLGYNSLSRIQSLSTPAAAPVADLESVYIPMANQKIISYFNRERTAGFYPRPPINVEMPIPRLPTPSEELPSLGSTTQPAPSLTMIQTFLPPYVRTGLDISPSLTMMETFLPPFKKADANYSPSLTMIQNASEVAASSLRVILPAPKIHWELQTAMALNYPVLFLDVRNAENRISYRLLVGQGGSNTIFTANREGTGFNQLRAVVKMPDKITAPLANSGDTLYVATADNVFGSLSILGLSGSGNAVYTARYNPGGYITQKPYITDDAVYIIGDNWGLMKLRKRETPVPVGSPDEQGNPFVSEIKDLSGRIIGRTYNELSPAWTQVDPTDARGIRKSAAPNPDVVAVLAANPEFVYCKGKRGELLVIDAKRGRTLWRYDASAFNMTVVNELHDRIFLASSSGVLVCLHDRNYRKPQLVITPPPPEKEIDPKKDPKDPKDPVDPKKDPEPKKNER